MATGPEHYAEGERLLAVAADVGSKANTATRDHCVKAAQAHFVAAQVAATMDLVGATVNGVVSPGWSAVLGQPEPPYHSPASLGTL